MNMNAPLPANLKLDLQGLVQAIALGQAEDGLVNPLQPAQWDVVTPYLQPVALSAGQVLFSRGDKDRSLYFVESGSLSVHYEDSKGRVRLGIASAGTVVGEGSFFSHLPRSATVQAGAACRLWGLMPIRFTELSNRHPEIALAIAMAAGSVAAKRLANRRRRIMTT